ncbi:ribonuclease P protein subunit [Candidatus Micrarchaeota archaeon]|nr:ribonuclease P protein subunit [Candidatus Micrarchaeota archaeon]
MITKNNILIHELIGLRVTIINSSCKNYIGIQGTIVDETKNTFVIETDNKTKIIPKKSSVFRFMLHNREHADIWGKVLTHAPEERIKKLINKVN